MSLKIVGKVYRKHKDRDRQLLYKVQQENGAFYYQSLDTLVPYHTTSIAEYELQRGKQLICEDCYESSLGLSKACPCCNTCLECNKGREVRQILDDRRKGWDREVLCLVRAGGQFELEWVTLEWATERAPGPLLEYLLGKFADEADV